MSDDSHKNLMGDMGKQRMNRFAVVGSSLASFLLIGTTLFAPSAHAAQHELDSWIAFPWEDAPAHIEFDSQGDVFRVCDKDADGLAAYGSLSAPGHGPYRYELVARQEGNCKVVHAGDGGAFNLPEGSEWTFEACAYNDNSDHAFECKNARWTA